MACSLLNIVSYSLTCCAQKPFFSPVQQQVNYKQICLEDLKGFKTWFSRTQKRKTVPKDLWLVASLYLVKTAQKKKKSVVFIFKENDISNPISCFSKATVLVELWSPTRKLYSHCVSIILIGRSSHCTALAWALSAANSQPDLISLITRPSQFTELGWQWLQVHSQPWLSYPMNLHNRPNPVIQKQNQTPPQTQLEEEHIKTIS